MTNFLSKNGQTTEDKFIDIDKVILKKNPRLYKILPRFIINKIKKIVHQDEINSVIDRNKHLYGLEFAEAVLKEFGTQVVARNIENIPKTGRYIIVANHPLGGLDGVALMHVVGKIRKDIVFPVNDILLNLKNFHPIFVPINKHGSNKQNIEILEESFASDKVILYFPAGLVSRKQNNEIKDLEWRKTIITVARKYKRDIIPAYIDGRNSDFFYKFANLRKSLGIKVNIEMIFLPDEMFKQYNKTITIIFGKIIPYQTFETSTSDKLWAEKLRDFVYQIKDGKEDFDFS